MVLGLKTKNRKSPSFQLDYLIHIQEIKPWPPSQSLRTLRAVLIQWEHGDRTSGSTKQAAPSLGTGSGVGDGRIEFNESFRLPVTLLREFSAKVGNGDTFQKNCIEFNLYEPRRDKTVKGLLGTAVIDFAEYGVVREAISISAPINCKRTYGNASQPVLHLKIQPVEKNRLSSSSRDSLTREASLDRNGVDSVSALMSEEYAEEAETASFTDDDGSSHSSLAVSSSAIESNGGSPLQNKEKEPEEMKASVEHADNVCSPALEQKLLKPGDFTTPNSSSKGTSSQSSSVDLTSDLAWITKKIGAHGNKLSSPVVQEVTEKENSNMKGSTFAYVPCDIGKTTFDNGISEVLTISAVSNVKGGESLEYIDTHTSGGDDDNATVPNNKPIYESDLTKNGSADSEKYENCQQNGKHRENVDEMAQCTEDESISSLGFDSTNQDSLESDTFSASRNTLAIRSGPQNIDKHSNKLVRSVRWPIESHRSNGLVRANPLASGETQSSVQVSKDRKDIKFQPKETRNIISDSKIKLLELRIKNLENELREAAAIEVGLYAVVAEHGSSTNKVHAPARRLSRFYLHASQAKSQSWRGSAAKSAISGLVLVAKACGNDVPRLTFWLSNAIVLRAIISESLSAVTGKNGIRNTSKVSSPLQWQSLGSKSIKSTLHENSDDWDDPYTFHAALEKVEAWIFSRIIESIWWQTLTPHMQSGVANAIPKGNLIGSHKTCQRTSSSFDEEQGTLSLELWKEAFRDACERICPIRAEGHECGCLPVLSKLIMEQCVARLDVAMFNAILRESADDIPADPVSDPIGDAKVLPVPVGKASFGAGAQLKNAIGNWSRWLTDLFGIDDDDAIEDVSTISESGDDESNGKDSTLKSFYFLNALSDLMMLPKDMLLSRTFRKEVCPTFSSSLIRRVLNSFVPDEFCPEPVPRVVLEALNSEDSFNTEEDHLINFPCNATPIVYLPPSAALVKGILGDAGSHYRLTRKGSLSLAKSYASDDELDELISPLSSILPDSAQVSSPAKTMWTLRESGSQSAMRYNLLREVWKNCDL